MRKILTELVFINIKNKLKINILILPLIFFAFKNNYIDRLALSYLVIALHEISHIIVAKICKIDIRTLTLHPFGLSITLNNEIIEHPNKEFLIAFAGPFSNIILCIVLSFFSSSEYIRYAYNLSFFLCLINIIPMLPLDGGRILKSMLAFSHGSIQAYIITKKISYYVNIFLVISLISLLLILFHNFYWLLIFTFIVGNLNSEQKSITAASLRTALLKKRKIINMEKIKSFIVYEDYYCHNIIKHLSFNYFITITVIGNSNASRILNETEVVDFILSNGIMVRFSDCIEQKNTHT